MTAQPTVSKVAPMETYRIRSADGWDSGTVCLREWRNGEHFAGEVIANSSFGAYAYTWGSMGEPLKQFLIGADFSYVMGKLAGERFTEYDGDATIKGAKRELLKMRRERDLDHAAARAAYGELDTVDEMDEHAVAECLFEIPAFQDCYWEMVRKRVNPQCRCFWDVILAPLIEQFRRELAPPSEADPGDEHQERP